NEPGQWMLHCHNLYHMDSGMARVVRYNTYKPSPEQERLDRQDHHRHDRWYQTGSLQLGSHLLEGTYRLSQTRNEFELRAEARQGHSQWEGEGDLFYRRWMSTYLNFIAGASTVHQETRGEWGVGYLLPLLIETKLLVDHKGQLRIDLEKKFQWTSHLFTEVEYIWRQDPQFESEYAVSLMYANAWAWAGGITYTESNLGL